MTSSSGLNRDHAARADRLFVVRLPLLLVVGQGLFDGPRGPRSHRAGRPQEVGAHTIRDSQQAERHQPPSPIIPA